MSTILDIENIKITSVNRKYGKGFYLTNEYRTFKSVISHNCRRGIAIKPPYRVQIFLAMYLDIDNPVKCILDGLADAGIIDNDRNITELLVIKEPIKKNKLGRIKVDIFGGQK